VNQLDSKDSLSQAIVPIRPYLRQLVLMAVAVTMGLGSRSPSLPMPDLISRFAGDIPWAWLVFLWVGLLMRKRSTLQVAAAASMIAVAIEWSQLYHAPWIDNVRQTTLGGLVLGYGFLWSDLICYALGILGGAFIERRLEPGKAKHP
jgi:hypothetical protein